MTHPSLKYRNIERKLEFVFCTKTDDLPPNPSFCHFQNLPSTKGRNYKSRQFRGTILVLCTWSHGALYVKFHVKISCDFQLTGRTLVPGLNGYLQYLLSSKGNNSKGRQTRLKVLVLCTSSHNLPLCEVSWKYLKWFSFYIADTTVCMKCLFSKYTKFKGP